MVAATLTDPLLIAQRDAGLARLDAVFTGQARTSVRLAGIGAWGDDSAYVEPEAWVAWALAHLAGQTAALRDTSAVRPLCLEFGPYGVHFIDRMLGARVWKQDGQWWSAELESPIGELPVPDLERDPTWTLARRTARAFTASGATLPLFGMPTLSSALNVGINLYGQRLLTALIDDSFSAVRDLRLINDLLITLHHWYQEAIPLRQLQPVVATCRCQPCGRGQICGCSTHLLSPRLYRDHIAPLDDALLAAWPKSGMIHLCGAHGQHLAAFHDMPHLAAVQVNDRAADELPRYAEGLRSDQVVYLNPTAQMDARRAAAVLGEGRLVEIV